MTTIGFNRDVRSLRIQRNLNETRDKLATEFERLSTGMRINRPSDDAASASMSSILRADAKIYGQAVRNVNDGLSYVNIAHEGLTQLSDIVIRQKELAEQASNGVISAQQRKALENEANALANEYNRIAAATKFNGRQVFSSSDAITIQTGIGEADGLTLSGGSSSGGGGASLSSTGFVGDGTFGAAGSFNAMISITSPYDFITQATTADINGDGNLDIIAGFTKNGSSSEGVAIALGDGSGGFSYSEQTGLFRPAGNLALADFNNDGRLDLFACKSGIYIQQADGSFGSTAGGWGLYSMSVADFNGDGNIDVFQDYSFSFGDGTGGWGSSAGGTGEKVGYLSASGDFNGDGAADLAFQNTYGYLSILMNDGSGNFSQYDTSLTTPSVGGAVYGVLLSNFGPIAIGDLNGDGKDDIVSTQVLLSNGDGTFSTNSVLDGYISGGQSSLVFTAINDVDKNGKNDIIAVTNDSQFPFTFTAHTFLQASDGSFSAAVNSNALTSSPTQYSITTWQILGGDFNNDGVTDLVQFDNDAGGFRLSLANSTLGSISGSSGSSAAATLSVSNQATVDFSTASAARSAIDDFGSTLQALDDTKSIVGSFESRLLISLNNIKTRQVEYTGAAGRIDNVDVAQSSSEMLRLSILGNLSSALLAQANQAPRLALSLLKDI